MRALTEVRSSVRQIVEQAHRNADVEAIVAEIKQRLSEAIREGAIEFDERFHRIKPESYARRLVVKDDALGYTAVAMTWAAGQRTAVHDHGGLWCVEGVVVGEMDVFQYDLLDRDSDLFQFVEQGRIHAGVGAAGCLIPPYEYHVLANASAQPSITLHIYGGEMRECNVYLLRGDGKYERQTRRLGYDD
jgi:predicted metal-dependent enzyme (double-stranded beta helix superfamily)